MKLDSAISVVELMQDLDGMDAFINVEFPSQEEEYIWEETHQGLQDSPDMDNVIDK